MFSPGAGGSGERALLLSQLTPMYLVMLVLAVVFSMPVVQKLRSGMRSPKTAAAGEACAYGVSLVLLLVCIFTLSSATYNPFIYFRF